MVVAVALCQKRSRVVAQVVDLLVYDASTLHVRPAVIDNKGTSLQHVLNLLRSAQNAFTVCGNCLS